MVSIKLRSFRYVPLSATVAMILFAPFCFARAVEIQLPPTVNYGVASREQEAQPATDTHKAPCDACTSYEAVALQKLLSQYKSLAENGGWPAWQNGKVVRVGQTDSRIPTLRQILTITGDYQSASGIPSASTGYDDMLVAAVKHFQERHGLNVDGTLGKSTQAMLAIPVEKRIEQIEATLERINKNPLPDENKFIVVNLPAYTLYGIENNATNVTMRVIVGNRANHTPLFDNQITDVIFNPPWSVPERIARNEMIPKLRKNPSYFINAGFIVTQDGVAVDPMNIDPSAGGYSFRQRPGTGNALGKIKFNIPDNDDIYLHSTSSPKLFQQEDRALSHGCIRLEKPRDLAHFVMEQDAGWNVDKIDHAYDSNTQRSVRVDSVPVHLVYWTAYVDAQGTAHFYNDVYNKDKAVKVKDSATSASVENTGTITVASK
jgi:murein L,D-transpeptidase YcbB/YkuD